ncbi:restriction endonuclease subunit S [Microtetraspora sp. AC03309]|nr:restriction endonuclease subunit S [Microtetraspora sp. AC03309]
MSVGNPQTPTAPGFRWVKLSDIARLESGHTPSRRKPEYWGGNIAWIGIRDATGNHGKVITSTFQSITESGLANSSARLLPAGTVCLSRTASVGYVVTMGIPMATSQDFVNWVCGPELSPAYLHYVFMSEQKSVQRFAHGTTHQTVYYPEAKAFHVCMPDRAEQDAIAAILRSLDDKIAVNDRIASTSILLATNTFEAIVAVDTVRLGDIAEIFDGPHATPYKTEEGPWFLSISSLRDGLLDLNESAHLGEEDFLRWTKRIQPHADDVLFSYETRLGEAALMLPQIRACLGRRMGLIRSKGSQISGALLLHAYLSREFQAEIKKRAVHGATVDRIPIKELPLWPIRLPPREDRPRLSAMLDSLHACIAERMHENRSLVALRDILLPELMSGRLRVRDAERIVEGAV